VECPAPREMGASSTVHDRYQEWEREGFFEELWRAGLLEYDEMEGIEWEWQALDGAMIKAPLGRGAIGKNPTDRAKMGTKRSMLTDGAGIPLAVAVEGANRHDSKLLVATLDGLVVARPAAPGKKGRKRATSSSTCAWRQPMTLRRYEKNWRRGATSRTSLRPTRRSEASEKGLAGTQEGKRGVGWWSEHIRG
jgi:hypothetical protein